MVRKSRLEASNVAPVGSLILIVNGTRAGRRPVAFGQGTLDPEVLQVGEPELRVGFSLKSSETILDVVGEAWFALLAVTHDVDTYRDLLGDGVVDRGRSRTSE